MEDRDVSSFYDELADSYHLIYEDWNAAIARQGDILNRFIRARMDDPQSRGISLLDCSCGIGTQTIGLAERGFAVTATDISPRSVARARSEAAKLGLAITFGIADFRTLQLDVPGRFDVVLSADNALPHLLADEEILLALRNMAAKLQDDGLLVLTIRDYDMLIAEKPEATQPRVMDQGKRIVFQVWDWSGDGRTYTTNHFIVQEGEGGQWQTEHHRTVYRALLRHELGALLEQAGLSHIQWHTPAESGYYQPIVTARKAGQL
ncbi:class I SAM-dependent methyltransferase [Paenibacillus nasutitermitis]|uniref:DNA-binding protein n=1 Tax=Paenibacillus nasutitermitis TaxID=1652958 RepID=A0A917E1K8_9BACL|nr:class I SAM-dependent methyltransferase [Paenibacillus nasutitermitis]GGD90297.1 DNA-binding protein [Paenibacillus nasutitermitis]